MLLVFLTAELSKHLTVDRLIRKRFFVIFLSQLKLKQE
jgi:hypothetical protein